MRYLFGNMSLHQKLEQMRTFVYVCAFAQLESKQFVFCYRKVNTTFCLQISKKIISLSLKMAKGQSAIVPNIFYPHVFNSVCFC